jgi:hypothetical protein
MDTIQRNFWEDVRKSEGPEYSQFIISGFWTRTTIMVYLPNDFTALELEQMLDRSLPQGTFTILADGAITQDSTTLPSSPSIITIKLRGIRAGAKKDHKSNQENRHPRQTNTGTSISSSSRAPLAEIDPLQLKDAWSNSQNQNEPSANIDLGTHQKLEQKLAEILTDRGLLPSSKTAHVKHIMGKLPHKALRAALQAEDAWVQLKQLASSKYLELLPPQLLQKKEDTNSNKAALLPTDLSIPQGAWINDDDSEATVIEFSSVNPHSRGIACATVEQAMTYIKNTSEQSNHGLALLVPSCDIFPPSIFTITRVRTSLIHNLSKEPCLFDCQVIQLGKLQVLRKIVDHSIPIPPDAVKILFLSYKTEVTENWETYCKDALKSLFQTVPDLSAATLSTLTKQTNPKRSEVRIMMLVRKQSMPSILKTSGQHNWYCILLDNDE